MSDATTNPGHAVPEAAPQVKADDKRPSRLGRGLSSLMGSAISVTPPAPAISSGDVPRGTSQVGPDVPLPTSAEVPRGTSDGGTTPADLELVWLDLTQVWPNRHQPRTHFDQEKLAELADSIRTHGVMQPVVVRPRPRDGSEQVGYELIAGERRWRAAQLAGIPALPAVIRDLDDEASAELALVENLQREDLNPIERAEALNRLNRDFGLTHEQIGEKIGLKRSSVSNLLRLLELGEAIRLKIAQGVFSMGHARALLGADSPEIQERVANSIEGLGGLSVRQAEELIRYENGIAAGEDLDAPVWHPEHPHGKIDGSGTPVPNSAGAKTSRKSDPAKSGWIQDLERQMSESLTTKVSIRPGRKPGMGQVTIHYHSLEDFDALLAKLGVQPQ